LSTSASEVLPPGEEFPVLTEWKSVRPHEKEWMFSVIILEVNTREIGQLTQADRTLCSMTPCHPSCTYMNCAYAGRNLAHPHTHARGTWLNAMWKHGNTVPWAQCHWRGANDIALKTRIPMRKVGSSANNIYKYFTNQPTYWRQKVRLDNELPNRITLRFADKMTGAFVTSKTLRSFL